MDSVPIYGFHPSTHAGYLAAVQKVVALGCGSAQMWMGNNKAYASKLIPQKEYDPVAEYVFENDLFLIAHSPYILNFARPLQKTDAGLKALQRYIRDLVNITNLGGVGSVLHMGFNVKELGQTTEECYQTFVDNLQWVVDRMPEDATIILENMAGKGTAMCCKMAGWTEFWQNYVPKELKRHVKWCIDTAHLFATGEYNISDPAEIERFYSEFDTGIGWENVMCIHFNGSKAAFASRIDNHADIGPVMSGKIQTVGLLTLARIAGITGVPLILEVPTDEHTLQEQFEIIENNIVN